MELDCRVYTVASDYGTCRSLEDRCETKKEHIKRINFEGSGNKKVIEEKLNKRIDFVCWPGGGFNHLTLELARNSGYLALTIGSVKNPRKPDPRRIHRVASLPANRACLQFRLNPGRDSELWDFFLNLMRASIKSIRRTLTAKNAN